VEVVVAWDVKVRERETVVVLVVMVDIMHVVGRERKSNFREWMMPEGRESEEGRKEG
jgi:hypothetical protein